MAVVESIGLEDIRNFVKARNYDIAKDPAIFRAVVAAFAVLLIKRHSQFVRVRGLFQKTLKVESKGFKCELLDLFQRCVFEGLDLDFGH